MQIFSNKSILIISPEPWGKSFVSKHHYAVQLAKQGNQVVFMGPPTQDYAMGAGPVDGLLLAEYPGFVKGYRFFPKPWRQYWLRKTTHRLEKLANCTFDVIWSFDNSVFFDLDSWGNQKLTISHIVDLNQDFETARAASSADICFCTTELIRERLSKYNAKAYKIHHGYALPQHQTPISLPGEQATKAIYIGNLSMPYLDWSLLRRVVEENPQVDFCFLGPDGRSNLIAQATPSPDREQIKKASNAYFLGEVPASEVFGHLLGADVCLVAYQEAHHQDQASPHKIVEYLASGKVVVATYTAEYDSADVLNMAKTNADFPVVFRDTLSQLDQHNGPERSAERQAFAKARTYPELVKTIEAKILSEVPQLKDKP
ncbi:MAG TPA: hypothetical protein DCE41_00925 [Cytophagales bacterium]|nr:hypothetical protein [Cytophagales bacterium]HAA22010.1 hypothetical protein [Cytophagales bacterium]HAP64562.1 hypothetical protein [Cytophagales bacterium]